MDNLLSQTSKTTKDYIISLTLNDKKNIYTSKIKKAEKNLKDYQKKVRDIKARHKKSQENFDNKEIIPRYNKDDMTKRIGYDSFNKMNQAIRVTTEIENMAGNILVDLSGHSDVMKNGVKKVEEMNENLDVSKSYLSEMINKQNYDKKIIISFGAFLFMITLFVLIYKIYKKF